jgi:site-specific DNA recombinase
MIVKSESKIVGIWIRVSTEDQARGESPENHEQRARYYAEAKGWQVKEVYHLEAVSGKSVMGNPETQRMLEHIRMGHISGIIFSKLARLARNTRELLEFAEIFRACNADLISLQESIDTSTPAGRLFYTMIAAMAQWEREEIVDRINASIPIRAKLGRPLGGDASFGFCLKDKKLVPDPQEAPVRKLIYELFLEHRRKKTVARLLNEKGYRTRNGSQFSDTTITRLLRDPTAKGMQRVNYTKSLGDRKKWVFKPKEEWVWRKVDPVVSEDLWDQCNLVLDEQEKKNKRPARKVTHLFTGFAICACGNKMYVPSSSPKYTCYKCHNKIGIEDIEEVFQQQLKAFFFSPMEISNYLSEADHVIKEKEDLLRVLGDEKSKLEKQIERVFQAYYDEKLNVDEFGSQHRPLADRKNQIEKEIPDIQGEIDFLKIQYLSSDHILHEAKDLYSRWSDLTYDEKRKIIENIVENITIDKEDVTINLCYLPHTPSKMASTEQRGLMDSLRRPA